MKECCPLHDRIFCQDLGIFNMIFIVVFLMIFNAIIIFNSSSSSTSTFSTVYFSVSYTLLCVSPWALTHNTTILPTPLHPAVSFLLPPVLLPVSCCCFSPPSLLTLLCCAVPSLPPLFSLPCVLQFLFSPLPPHSHLSQWLSSILPHSLVSQCFHSSPSLLFSFLPPPLSFLCSL